MLAELHMIQNFAPSNLNRDDASAPKDCMFGGCRRARISSQCQKRSIRAAFRQELIDRHDLAIRTRRVATALTDRLVAAGHERPRAESVVRLALRDTCLEPGADNRGKCLMFVGERELDAMAAAIDEHWQSLLDALDDAATEHGRARRGRSAGDAGRGGASSRLRAALEQSLDGGKAIDLALFGRLVTDLPTSTITGACQVAHALSTHQVKPELDFFTAVDDLRPRGASRAEMVGALQFNSACFYRYANIDLEQLTSNLHGDQVKALQAAELFLRAAVRAIPMGKQTSWAAHNPPSLVFLVVRDGGFWSLANAFVDPVRPSADGDLVGRSAVALLDYWQRLTRMYGSNDVRFAGLASLHDLPGADGSCAGSAPIQTAAGLEDLIARTMAALAASPEGATTA
ncbi:MAG: type I-E CRISPR-associated protein Cas7/Cse4/CasC [Chloroflexota bacterium]